MLDTYRTEVAASYPQTIVEKRAPTDESMRLIREYEDRAWAQVVSSGVASIKEINIEGIVIQRQLNPHSFSTVYVIAFRLNGIEHSYSISEDQTGVALESRRALQMFVEKLAAQIAANLISASVRSGIFKLKA